MLIEYNWINNTRVLPYAGCLLIVYKLDQGRQDRGGRNGDEFDDEGTAATTTTTTTMRRVSGGVPGEKVVRQEVNTGAPQRSSI